MNATDADKLKMLILIRLRQVIDPETNVDVIRMQLVKNLTVDDQGMVRYTIRPSSPICPSWIS